MFQHFADNYTSADFDRIKFDWNDKYGDKFHDNNYEFRTQLCEFLLPQLNSVRLELVRDPYLELGKSSEATFGVYMNFHRFAQQLLERGGPKYLMDYIKGSSHTMDTSLASRRILLTKEKALELLAAFDEQRKQTSDPNEMKLLNDYIRQRLEYHASR
jgi:hypothetical protein